MVEEVISQRGDMLCNNPSASVKLAENCSFMSWESTKQDDRVSCLPMMFDQEVIKCNRKDFLWYSEIMLTTVDGSAERVRSLCTPQTTWSAVEYISSAASPKSGKSNQWNPAQINESNTFLKESLFSPVPKKQLIGAQASGRPLCLLQIVLVLPTNILPLRRKVLTQRSHLLLSNLLPSSCIWVHYQ